MPPCPFCLCVERRPNPATSTATDGRERAGEGTLQMPDGGRYEGEWEDDVKHGKGTVFLHTVHSLMHLLPARVE